MKVSAVRFLNRAVPGTDPVKFGFEFLATGRVVVRGRASWSSGYFR